MRSTALLLISSLIAPGLAAPPRCSSLGELSKAVSWFTGYSDAADEMTLSAAPDDTIYMVLKERQEFSKLVKMIDTVPSIREILDSNKKLTFFAPDNDALEGHHYQTWHTSDDKNKKQILEDTFKYNMVPDIMEYRSFGQNSTIATQLQAKDGSFDDAKRRIKIEVANDQQMEVVLNNYVKIIEKDIRAKNGVIQKIDRPMYVPPDIMDLLFMLPAEFSISTTAVLKTNLQGNLEFNSDNKRNARAENPNDRHGRGSPLTTFFVPSNEAWNKLPEDLQYYLFSPSGERTLRKLMAWHTLPDNVVFSEWSRRLRRGDFYDDEPDLSFEWDRHFDSLINQKLPVHVKKTRSNTRGYKVDLQAHGIYATIIDNPAQNGVFHVVPQVLSPRRVEGVNEAQNEKDWKEWEQWLTKWSSEHNDGAF